MKKWNEKKEMLDELYNAANTPKIKAGDFGNLTKSIIKLMNDSNFAVQIAAVKVCGPLAKGVRKEFEACAKELVPSLLQKFKEKKAGFAEEILSVFESFQNSINMDNIVSELTTALQDKAPTVKKNTCVVIEKMALMTYIDVLQRCSPDIISALMKLSEDKEGEVRDAALNTLGIFKGRLGESAMSKYLTNLNPQKLEKVN